LDLFDHQTFLLPLSSVDDVAEMVFWPQFLSCEEADNLLKQSIADLPWRADKIKMFGKEIPVPRLQNWFADKTDTSYTYSGIKLTAIVFPDWLNQLRENIQTRSNYPLNRALANYYRDGSDSMDWHADDEAELGPDPVIASLSLGAERTFQLRHNQTKEKVSINLPHGSLLVMGPKIQTFWKHRIAKVRDLQEPRINFTFRYVND
jgi:alkylated DNA repair dioxygenase AlkB